MSVATPAPLTDADLAAIEAYANAATQAPWTLGPAPHFDVEMGDGTPLHDSWFGSDARFCAHAREDVPRLLAALRKARRALREAAEHIDSGATLIESEIGDLDGECAEEREFAASLRVLAGGTK